MQDAFDMRDDNLFKAASGLSGGIGQMRDACGALLGASLILGFKHGRGREEIDNLDKMKDSQALVGKLYKWFEKEFGSATCRDIRTSFGGGVYYDINVPWQKELANEAGIPEKCAELTGKVAVKTAEMLLEIEASEKE